MVRAESYCNIAPRYRFINHHGHRPLVVRFTNHPGLRDLDPYDKYGLGCDMTYRWVLQLMHLLPCRHQKPWDLVQSWGMFSRIQACPGRWQGEARRLRCSVGCGLDSSKMEVPMEQLEYLGILGRVKPGREWWSIFAHHGCCLVGTVAYPQPSSIRWAGAQDGHPLQTKTLRRYPKTAGSLWIKKRFRNLSLASMFDKSKL